LRASPRHFFAYDCSCIRLRPRVENALLELNLMDRNDPITEMIAASILDIAATGELDPKKILEAALHKLGVERKGRA
jgi:hypothetical protein